ncbi:hypothetical protein MKW98_022405 [Papaver atlanticum]|uniref:Disease resistance R13L4/SHOC-2-like LRR domain-containing protein n=1 Tax=Papaver atlanticum TaxID=357466 RepID=A0AAD4SG47_9MAGN|nr:hypothetical protein MKW98_022405 [Papaver atlanticum]
MVGSISPSLGKLKYLRLLKLANLKRLTGTIPPELGKLLHLTDLLLSSNQLKGSIPASFQNLHKLNQLSLNDNLLSRSIPSTIGFLKNLDFLRLHNNMLTGKLPDSLGNLTNLYVLSASNNRLTGKIPPSLSNLICPIPCELIKLNATLDSLYLSFNPLSLVNIPSWISKMSLGELHLARTGLLGELPEWLSSTSLLDLDLSSNMLAGVLPAWIGNITSLVSLNISNNGFHSDIPIELMNLYLQNLDLHSNNFTGGLGSIFPKDHDLNQYSIIDLSYNMFVGRLDNIGNLGSMEYLETLVLSNNHLGGSMPESFGKFRSLKTLKLENNGFTEPPFPASSFKGNSGLCDSPLPRCKTAW